MARKYTKEDVSIITNNICSQLNNSVEPNILLSWGVSDFTMSTIFHDMPTFIMKVNGRLFKGLVAIAWCESSDLYKVYLLSMEDQSEKCVSDACYADNLGDVIDTAIERGTDPEEYKAFCRSQRDLLFKKI